jgi:hypothetical protein
MNKKLEIKVFSADLAKSFRELMLHRWKIHQRIDDGGENVAQSVQNYADCVNNKTEGSSSYQLFRLVNTICLILSYRFP